MPTPENLSPTSVIRKLPVSPFSIPLGQRTEYNRTLYRMACDEQEVDSWLVSTTEEDDDAAAANDASVYSNLQPPRLPWTPSFLRRLHDLHEHPERYQTLEIERDPILQRDADEFRTADLGDYENPGSDSSSDMAGDPEENIDDIFRMTGDPEENIDDIFRVWEIITDPELEKGTLTDIFESSLKVTLSDDGAEGFSGSQTSVDAGVSIDLQSVESVIAAMSDLKISGSDEDRNG